MDFEGTKHYITEIVAHEIEILKDNEAAIS